MNKNPSGLQNLRNILHKEWRILVALAICGMVALVTVTWICWQIITPAGARVLTRGEDVAAQNIAVGLVLGAGVNPQGKPYKELQARLDVAAEGLQKGWVKKLILSGDNRVSHYNEPIAMKNYLVNEKRIDPAKLAPDYAGRSTYESCERARKIFGQTRLVIFSAGSHLPRAIYLCEHFGIESFGVSSQVEANNSGRREILARVKAVYNIYIRGEKTVLGEQIVL